MLKTIKKARTGGKKKNLEWGRKSQQTKKKKKKKKKDKYVYL
jgi:hypothetical protein